MDSPVVGSLVVPSPRYRRQMGTGEGAALMLATRRGSALLFYFGTDRGFWVPTRQIAAIPAEAVPAGCLELLLHELMVYLEAEECEIEEFLRDDAPYTPYAPEAPEAPEVPGTPEASGGRGGGGRVRLRLAVRVPAVTRTQWTVLQGRLGSVLGDVTFDPRSMSSVLLRLELAGAPAPAPAATPE